MICPVVSKEHFRSMRITLAFSVIALSFCIAFAVLTFAGILAQYTALCAAFFALVSSGLFLLYRFSRDISLRKLELTESEIRVFGKTGKLLKTFPYSAVRELRVVTLRVVDEFWMDHIDAMDDLRQGIRLRAYAQTDPVIEYKREGFDMFEAMNDAIKEEIVRRVFLVRLKTNEEIKRQRVAKVTGEGAGGDKTVRRQPVVKKIKVGPNDPCPCGSGKKYKKCCRDKDLAAERGQQTN